VIDRNTPRELQMLKTQLRQISEQIRALYWFFFEFLEKT
jgi:hypothetical protein